MTENVEQQEVEVTEAAPVEQSEESAPPSDETPKPEEKETKVEVEEEPKLTQKQVDEAIQKRLARESRKLERQIRAEVENQYLRERLENQNRQQVTEQPSGEPKPEQFKTYEEYLDKLTDWKVDQRLQKVYESTQQQQQIESQSQYEARLRDNLNKAADKYEDFEEVITNPSLTISPVMADALGESDIGGEIAYYLGIHPKEAAEIAGLSNVAQVKAIDRIEAKLKTPQITKAPAPMETVGKGRAQTTPNVEKMSVSEYADYRRKSGARWARR